MKEQFLELLERMKTADIESLPNYKAKVLLYAELRAAKLTATEARMIVARTDIDVNERLTDDPETLKAMTGSFAAMLANLKASLAKIDPKLFGDTIKYGQPVSMKFNA